MENIKRKHVKKPIFSPKICLNSKCSKPFWPKKSNQRYCCSNCADRCRNNRNWGRRREKRLERLGITAKVKSNPKKRYDYVLKDLSLDEKAEKIWKKKRDESYYKELRFVFSKGFLGNYIEGEVMGIRNRREKGKR